MDEAILVTGGAGYIGSHVVKLLGESGHKIVVLDDLSTGHKESVLYGHLVVGDIGIQDDLDKVFHHYNIKAVLHFAGSIVVPESVTDPVKYYHNNTVKTLNLIQSCIKNNVNNFIFSSTAAVYGMGETGSLDETVPFAPINPYGRSKMMIEMILEDVSNAHKDFNYIALRYFNVAGADLEGRIGQSFPDATHLIKVAMQVALGMRSELSVFGDDYNTSDGTCIRDYIHVIDLAQAHLDALKYLSNNDKSEVLNCGYGNGYSVNEVIEVVKKVTGKDFSVKITGRRLGDPDRLVAMSDKIRKVLGWNPKYNDLELIVNTAFEWEKKLLTTKKGQ